MDSKKYLAPVTLAVLIALFIYLYWSIQPFLLKTDATKSFWVNIHGIVLPNESIVTQDAPQYVRIFSYPSPSDFEYLCNGKANIVGIAKINWTNSAGEYAVSIELPLSTSVIVATDCGDCNKQKVDITSQEKEKEIDLLIGGRNCGNGFKISDNYFDEKIAAERLSTSQMSYFSEQLDKSQNIDIQKDRELSNEFLQSARGEEKSNITNAYMDILRSEILSQRAKYKARMYALGNCVEEFTNLLNGYNNSLCYVPDYGAFQEFSNSNMTYFSYLSDTYYERDPRSYTSADILKSRLFGTYDAYINMDHKVYECAEALKLMNETFKLQSTYCKQKATSVWLLSTSTLLILIGIGILIGQRWQEGNNQCRGNKKKP